MPYKTFLPVFLLFTSVAVNAQDKVSAFLNENAKVINISEGPALMDNYVPPLFNDAQVFAFGEATHNGKEFFLLKNEFFKHLVLNYGVRVFLLEDDPAACYKANQYLDSEALDASEVVGRLSFGIWRTEEMCALLNWMKSFNSTVAQDKQLVFAGIDCQSSRMYGDVILNLLKQHNIKVSPGKLSVLDECVQIKAGMPGLHDKEDDYLKKIDELYSDIVLHNGGNNQEVKLLFSQLKRAVQFACTPSPRLRDKLMAENVMDIKAATQSKCFISAHNLHVCKQAQVTPMGYYLSDWLNERYVNVGFDYGAGRLFSLGAKDGYATVNVIEKPAQGTYAQTFFNTGHEVFMLDIANARKNRDMKKFLKGKKMVLLGADGYKSQYSEGIYHNISETYDYLIFFKNISPPAYLTKWLPAYFQVKE